MLEHHEQVKMDFASGELAAHKADVYTGYGRCTVCNCAEYKGVGEICERCGHNYNEHW